MIDPFSASVFIQTIVMQNSRRKFIQTASLAMVGACLQPSELWSNPSLLAKTKRLIGIQLYSVRDDMDKNPLETLTALSKMGYQYVEHAYYVNRKLYGWTATEFKNILNDLGLQMLSGHTVLYPKHWNSATNNFTDDWKLTIEDAATLGQSFVISPSMDSKLRSTYDGLMMLLDVFNKSGELCKASGMKFGYHNHEFEFRTKLNDTTVYDLILQHTDPQLVIHQLDIGNMYGGGGRAAEWITKYPGRFQSLHVKDEMKVGMKEVYESTLLGTGIIDPKAVALLAKKIGGSKHFIIEQESYQGLTQIECAKRNLDIIKTWGI